MKRTTIKRGTSELKRSPLARGESQLQRTELKRGTTPIPQRSEKRKAQEVERVDVRAEVLRRAGAERPDDLRACSYRLAVPEVACGWLPDRRTLEVDELRGGSYRSAEWLDPEQCRAPCPVHHDYKTAHKDDVLARLAQLEGRPPHARA